MKNLNYLLLAGSIVLLSAFTFNAATNWTISENHSIKFSGTEVEGIFKSLSGDVKFDANELGNSAFNFSVDVNSINTGNGMKNKHAVSDKWFDAEKFPTIKFKSSSFKKTDKGYTVKGIMNIHGVNKEVSVPFTFSNNTFKAMFSVNRLDYLVGTMKGMSKKVSDEIKLNVSIPVTK